MTWVTPTASADVDARPRKNVALWQALTITLLIAGYAGYYLCRSNLSVTLPMIIAEMASKGMEPATARIRFGTIASFGVLAYAIGKFISGSLADFLGGRRNFLTGMGLAIACTLVFASGSSMPIFGLAWVCNRLVQSLGWAGMVKITSKWFSYRRYGTAMGLISLSYLFGDALSRRFLAALIAWHLTWREVFVIAAGVLGALFVACCLLLRESPAQIGAKEPRANPANLFGKEGDRPAPEGLKTLLRPLVRSEVFWIVCVLSLGTTLVRETFGLWTPTYFTQAAGLNTAEAAEKSALFPLLGGVSVLLCGWLSDRLGPRGRASVTFFGLALSGAVLLWLGLGSFAGSHIWPLILVSLVAFLIVGPYSFLAGAMALDFGGKQGAATASGVIDGVGYLGGVLAGDAVARVSVSFGWGGVFVVLGVVASLTAAAAFVFWLREGRHQSRTLLL
jgi:OPA family glycerol-3-phosphate transporter-like MFS transporter